MTPTSFINVFTRWILWGIILLVASPLLLVLILMPQNIRYRNRVYFFIARLTAHLLLAAAGIRVRVVNGGSLPTFPHDPAIIIMNHPSTLDIPAIEVLIGMYPRIWISKKEYGDIPLFGFLVRRMHVLLDRENPRAALKSLITTCELAQIAPSHILIFPEGTRASDGALQPFLSGFVMLAKKLKRPVIPVAINGSFELMSKQTNKIRSGEISLVVGEHLLQAADESDTKFLQRVTLWFKNNVHEIRTSRE